jgi:hypothetical protein
LSRDRLAFPQPEIPDYPTDETEPDESHYQLRGVHEETSFRVCAGVKSRSRLAFVTTVMDDAAMAAPAIIGESKIPKNG